MGYTAFSWDKILPYTVGISSVLDLGAQNNYIQPHLPAPYMRETYEQMGIHYVSIDLNGEDGAMPWDLGEKNVWLMGVELVVDCGTSEHVGRDGKFSWEAIYNCTKFKFEACLEGYYIYSENPFTGNWPGHGFNYYTTEFYRALANMADVRIADLGLHAACHNYKDGWNVYCAMEKTGLKFPTLQEFMTLPLKTE